MLNQYKKCICFFSKSTQLILWINFTVTYTKYTPPNSKVKHFLRSLKIDRSNNPKGPKWKNIKQSSDTYDKDISLKVWQLSIKVKWWDPDRKILVNIFATELLLHKKWSLPLRISSVNATKSAVSRGFCYIYQRKP